MDLQSISDDSVDYFGEIYSFNNQRRAEQLRHEYHSARDVYHGVPISDAHM